MNTCIATEKVIAKEDEIFGTCVFHAIEFLRILGLIFLEVVKNEDANINIKKNDYQITSSLI